MEENDNLENEELEVTMKSHAMKYGLILGMVGLIVTVLLYIIDPSLLGNPWVGLLILVYFGFLIWAGINYRNQTGGYIDFRPAFMHAMIILVISGLISTVFQMILYSVIDPDLPAILADAGAETARSMAERFGATGDVLDDAIDQARTDTLARLTPMGLIKSYFWALIVYAVVSAISGLIVRKRVPEDDLV